MGELQLQKEKEEELNQKVVSQQETINYLLNKMETHYGLNVFGKDDMEDSSIHKGDKAYVKDDTQ